MITYSGIVPIFTGISISPEWAWGLFAAAIPAAAVGWLATQVPEWLELAVGIPAILLTYGAIIWFVGFRPEDRVLFRRNMTPAEGADSTKGAV